MKDGRHPWQAVSRFAGAGRRFLFLQGPHGPFFAQLGRLLRRSGAEVRRVGFNAGDALFWPDRAGYIGFRDPPEAWPARLDALIAEHGITDIALYGDARPVHAAAAATARRLGLTLHVFEEGYLRPYWVTYERGGANGNSPLMGMGIDAMRAALGAAGGALPAAPARWGDLRAHVLYGALYHFPVLALNAGYPGFRPHRDLTVGQEFRAYFRRLVALPAHATRRHVATRRVLRGGFAYHLVLLQLAHDSSVRNHSRFSAMEQVIDICLAAFARGAPTHHHIVVKAHPLDDGRADLRRHLRQGAAMRGLAGRAHFLPGGKLGPLLDVRAQCRHGQLHRRAAGAVARPAGARTGPGGLWQAGTRFRPAFGRLLCRSATARPGRLCRLSALSLGNVADFGQLLLGSRPASGAAGSGRPDAGPGKSLWRPRSLLQFRHTTI